MRPQGLAKRGGGTTGGPGWKPSAASDFLRFLLKKTFILEHFFIKEGHAVSAVTMDNAKIFSQILSKSRRSSAKISERRLQPLSI